tara:strand:- start:1148 stop:1684 length:537 start_codon:yes stop_codon:yes gene_type:complete
MTNLLVEESAGGFMRWSADLGQFVVDKEPCDLKKFLVNFASLETGWLIWENNKPNWVMDENRKRGVQPDTRKEWKRGFIVKTYLRKKDGAEESGYYTWSTDQKMSLHAVNDIYKDLESNSNHGEMQIIKVKKYKEIEGALNKKWKAPVLVYEGNCAMPAVDDDPDEGGDLAADDENLF